MRHFFILGNHPGLSAAEIFAEFGFIRPDNATLSPQTLVSKTGKDFSAASAMERLGGTIKVGRLLDEAPTRLSHEEWITRLADYLEQKATAPQRPTFGISLYAASPDVSRRQLDSSAKFFVSLGLAVKKELKARGVPARWVEPRPGVSLSSVVVDKNHLIETGAEFVFLVHSGDQVELGVTEAVQPFEEFSEVDYGRPVRDTVQGMLPPKLARLMVNMAAADHAKPLLDPFCGSGTVLTEALRVGFTRVIGSDHNPAAIDATRQNVDWCREKQLFAADAEVELLEADARNLIRQMPQSHVNTVVSEIFLGPPRRGKETRGELQRSLGQIQKLLYESLSSWRRLLRPGATLVLALPLYILGTERHGLSASEFAKLGFRVVRPLPPNALQALGAETTKTGNLLYGRPGQLVWREIVKLVWDGPTAE